MPPLTSTTRPASISIDHRSQQSAAGSHVEVRPFPPRGMNEDQIVRLHLGAKLAERSIIFLNRRYRVQSCRNNRANTTKQHYNPYRWQCISECFSIVYDQGDPFMYRLTAQDQQNTKYRHKKQRW